MPTSYFQKPTRLCTVHAILHLTCFDSGFTHGCANVAIILCGCRANRTEATEDVNGSQ